jgi:hypothetical protein
MLDSWYYYVGMSVLVVLLCFVAPPLLAVRKGYAWYFWILACGVLGLVVLAFLPYANAPTVEAKVKRARRRTGNTVGGALSVLLLLGVLPVLALPALAFLEAQSIRESSWIWRFSELLVLMSPGLLVDLGGLVLALVWWRRHPTVSLLTVLARCVDLPRRRRQLPLRLVAGTPPRGAGLVVCAIKGTARWHNDGQKCDQCWGRGPALGRPVLRSFADGRESASGRGRCTPTGPCQEGGTSLIVQSSLRRRLVPRRR